MQWDRMRSGRTGCHGIFPQPHTTGTEILTLKSQAQAVLLIWLLTCFPYNPVIFFKKLPQPEYHVKNSYCFHELLFMFYHKQERFQFCCWLAWDLLHCFKFTVTLLPLPSEYWGYWHVPPHLTQNKVMKSFYTSGSRRLWCHACSLPPGCQEPQALPAPGAEVETTLLTPLTQSVQGSAYALNKRWPDSVFVAQPPGKRAVPWPRDYFWVNISLNLTLATIPGIQSEGATFPQQFHHPSPREQMS